MVQKAVCFVSVANRGLRPKSRLQKAKTPARMLALTSSGTLLPKGYYTLGSLFVNRQIEEIAGEAAGEMAGKSQNPQPLNRSLRRPA